MMLGERLKCLEFRDVKIMLFSRLLCDCLKTEMT